MLTLWWVSWDNPQRPVRKNPPGDLTEASSVHSNQTSNTTTKDHWAEVKLSPYPFHMELEVWVEAVNQLGAAESVHLRKEAQHFGE